MKTPRWLALLPLLFALPALQAQAQSKTYRCLIDGRTVFQQSACPVGAEPEPIKPAAEASAPKPFAPTSSHAGARSTMAASGAASGAATKH